MPSPLRIELFGGLNARIGKGARFEFRPNFTGNLLAYLALFPRLHPREELADRLWPDELDSETARHKLRQTLRQLRIKLDEIEPGLADRALLASAATVGLNPEAVITDLSEFEEAIAAAGRASAPADRAADLQRAVDLRRGELLAGFYVEHFSPERERSAARYRAALSDLLSTYDALGEPARAVDVAQRCIAEDPLSEEAHLALMRLYAHLGRPGEVTRQYQALCRALKEELGVEPELQTSAAYEALVAEGRSRAVGSGKSEGRASVVSRQGQEEQSAVGSRQSAVGRGRRSSR